MFFKKHNYSDVDDSIKRGDIPLGDFGVYPTGWKGNRHVMFLSESRERNSAILRQVARSYARLLGNGKHIHYGLVVHGDIEYPADWIDFRDNKNYRYTHLLIVVDEFFNFIANMDFYERLKFISYMKHDSVVVVAAHTGNANDIIKKHPSWFDINNSPCFSLVFIDDTMNYR